MSSSQVSSENKSSQRSESVSTKKESRSSQSSRDSESKSLQEPIVPTYKNPKKCKNKRSRMSDQRKTWDWLYPSAECSSQKAGLEKKLATGVSAGKRRRSQWTTSIRPSDWVFTPFDKAILSFSFILFVLWGAVLTAFLIDAREEGRKLVRLKEGFRREESRGRHWEEAPSPVCIEEAKDCLGNQRSLPMFGPFSLCSVTCGGGTTLRVERDQHCVPVTKQYECNTFACPRPPKEKQEPPCILNRVWNQSFPDFTLNWPDHEANKNSLVNYSNRNYADPYGIMRTQECPNCVIQKKNIFFEIGREEIGPEMGTRVVYPLRNVYKEYKGPHKCNTSYGQSIPIAWKKRRQEKRVVVSSRNKCQVVTLRSGKIELASLDRLRQTELEPYRIISLTRCTTDERATVEDIRDRRSCSFTVVCEQVYDLLDDCNSINHLNFSVKAPDPPTRSKEEMLELDYKRGRLMDDWFNHCRCKEESSSTEMCKEAEKSMNERWANKSLFLSPDDW